jgi:tetratricopeptide (TPR) repeat protein
MFYYESNLDLKKALEWMNAAIAATPTPQMWMVYRKGLILEKMGDKAGALAAAQQSLDIVKNDTQSPASLKDEYTRLNNALIARLK